MTQSQMLQDLIEEFLTRPIPDDLEISDYCRVRSDRQGGALAHLLGALSYMVEPGAPALTKRAVAQVVREAIEFGIRTEQDDLARITQRGSNALAA